MNKGRQSRYESGQRHSNRPRKSELVDTISSEIIEQLRICAHELEEKQDRYERIVKISRDITIDSKRLIFYLHTFQRGSPDAENVLVEAKTRLVKIVKSHFSNIIKELKNLDIHQYIRAYTFGVQEFIEALSFYHYLVNNSLLTFQDVEEFLEESLSSDEFLEKEEFEKSEKNPVDKDKGDENILMNNRQPSIQARFPDQYYFLTMMDYVLGLSDLTGELMRYCINQVAAGRMNIAFDTCRFLTNLYTGMLSVGCHNREFSRKMYTFIQSVKKVEMACYTVKVRGSEMSKDMIFNVLDNEAEHDEIHF